MDATGAQRQQKRLARMKDRGIERSTVLVHTCCKPALDELRPHLQNPYKADALSALVDSLRSRERPTNVSQVKQLSPFRYPGGKTWLVPEVRKWLTSGRKPSVFVEPFAGGAMAGLTVAAERLADHVFLGELDADVAAVWRTVFGRTEDSAWLCKSIASFDVSRESVLAIIDKPAKAVRTKAFRTVIKNRMQRGGILADGASLMKDGEGGKGLRSRWYPETLVSRIEALHAIKDRITFKQIDAFQTINSFSDDASAFFFVDPPYTAGGKRAGKRLYAHSVIDHPALFEAMSKVAGSVMMTYDDAPEVRELAAAHSFRVESVPMKSTHHAVMQELLILKP